MTSSTSMYKLSMHVVPDSIGLYLFFIIILKLGPLGFEVEKLGFLVQNIVMFSYVYHSMLCRALG